MENTKNLKNKIIKGIDILGELSMYIFIISLFLNGKLNLKTRYVIEFLFALKLIFDWKNIRLKGKKIYLTMGIITVLGLVFNFLVSQGDGAKLFFEQNIKFLIGIIFLTFIDSEKKFKKATSILVIGATILAYSEVVKKIPFIEYSLARTRPLIMMSAVYITILFLQRLKDKKENYWKYIYIFPGILTVLGIMYSDSRMGFLTYMIIIFIYLLYNLYLHRIRLKNIMVILIIGFTLSLGVHKSMPENFKNKIKTSFQTKNNFSNEARLVMWKGGVEAFRSKILTGVGSSPKDTQPFNIKSAEKYPNDHIKNDFIKNKNFTEHHSIYINFLSQNGIIITFLYFYLFFIQIPKRLMKNKRNTVAIGSYFALLSFLIYGITWSVWTMYSVVQILFQIFLAILIFKTEDEEVDENDNQK